MLLQEALELMKTGEAVCRKDWTEKDGYLTILNGAEFVWKVIIKPQVNAGNYIFSIEDLCASDWKKFEATKPVEEDIEDIKE